MVVLIAATLFGMYLAYGCNRPHRLRWHIAALLAAIAAFIYTLTEAEWAVSQSLLLNVEPGIGPTLAAWGAIGLAVGEVVAFAAFLSHGCGSTTRAGAGRSRRRRPQRAVAARRTCAASPFFGDDFRGCLGGAGWRFGTNTCTSDMPSPSSGVIVRTSRQTPRTMHSISATYSIVACPRDMRDARPRDVTHG